MKNRVIFLDIDGVLNGRDYFRGKDYQKRKKEDIHSKMICRRNLFWVGLLCRIFKLKVVLSSSWRCAWNYDGTLNEEFADSHLAVDKLLRSFGINIVSRTINKVENLGEYETDPDVLIRWTQMNNNGLFVDSDGKQSILPTETLLSYARGAQILKWIEENNFEGKYIILEDDTVDILLFKVLKHHLVSTCFYKRNFGFRFKHFVKAFLKLL